MSFVIKKNFSCLDECTIQRKKLEDENLDMKTKLENLKIQAKSLQSELDEELLKSSSERSKLEMERDELKEKLVQTSVTVYQGSQTQFHSWATFYQEYGLRAALREKMSPRAAIGG